MQAISMETTVQNSIIINALPAKVWAALTQPRLMPQWMFNEHAITIDTDWQPGSAITISGETNGFPFVNNGVVLQYEEEKVLSYTHRSSLSNLPKDASYYTTLSFKLVSVGAQTVLSFTAHNFATESIYHHIAYYWRVALAVLKNACEWICESYCVGLIER